MVTVEVGSEKHRYLLYKGLLISRGGTFFSGTFDGQFAESRTGVLSLPEETAASFELFVDWLYAGHIPQIPTKDVWKDISIHEMKTAGLLETESVYHKVYYMADKWCIPDLKNKTVDCIRQFHDVTTTTVHPHLVEQGYANTPINSTLRRYLMQAAAYANRDPSCDKSYFSYSLTNLHRTRWSLWLMRCTPRGISKAYMKTLT